MAIATSRKENGTLNLDIMLNDLSPVVRAFAAALFGGPSKLFVAHYGGHLAPLIDD
jgi:hypothetical protein